MEFVPFGAAYLAFVTVETSESFPASVPVEAYPAFVHFVVPTDHS